MLKKVSLILIWLELMFSQKAMCGSVEASRAGNPEGGGSSRVGGNVVCWWKSEFEGYVRLGIIDWEGAASFFKNKKNNEKMKKIFYGVRP